MKSNDCGDERRKRENDEERPPFDPDAWCESMSASVQALIHALEPLAEIFERTTRVVNKRVRPIRRELQRLGIIDGYPPQHNYRQTRRGRVPRLTPAIRAKKREIRERR